MGHYEPDWAAHEARAGHLADMPLHTPLRVRDGQAWAEMLRDAPDEVVVSLLLLQIRSALAYSLGPVWHELVWHVPKVLGRRRPAVSAADAVWAVRMAADMPDTYDAPSVMDVAVALAGWCDQPGEPMLLHAVEILAATVDANRQIMAKGRARLRRRLLSLRPEVPAGAPLEITMIRPDDGWSRAVLDRARAPADADTDATRLARLAVREVKAALAGERSRLEGLLADERSWAVADWRRWYLGHPVTGPLTRGLIWSFSTGMTGIPADGGLLDGPGGQHPIPPEATVRLWHPARADTAQVRQWRDYLVSAERTQPFKQAFREVYLITPAELETRLYSNRFAAHVLRYQQAYALFRERGWTANYLGPYDGGYEGQARRDFPGVGLTAYFDHYPVDAGPFAYPVDLCSTDRVGFCRTGDRHRAPVPLAEVPELVFSEAMRDVDLFISVTSIATDPRWADRGEDPHFAYWREYSFGDLTEIAVVRGEALARLVPKLKIAPRLELTGRYLRVQGQLNSYKIHIGSGNVLIEPDDRYLCIVPASGRATVMLPFDGDQMMSIILSKAVLLAADDRITDPSITHQLSPR
jgi:hypothetical protein